MRDGLFAVRSISWKPPIAASIERCVIERPIPSSHPIFILRDFFAAPDGIRPAKPHS
jgi:hypothetical protein